MEFFQMFLVYSHFFPLAIVSKRGKLFRWRLFISLFSQKKKRSLCSSCSTFTFDRFCFQQISVRTFFSSFPYEEVEKIWRKFGSLRLQHDIFVSHSRRQSTALDCTHCLLDAGHNYTRIMKFFVACFFSHDSPFFLFFLLRSLSLDSIEWVKIYKFGRSCRFLSINSKYIHINSNYFVFLID